MPVGTWVIRTAESVVLTLCPPGPLLRKTSMRRSFSSIVDVDLLGLGQHQDAGRAGVHPALRLGDRHPLDAVHAALELQQAVRRLARLGRALGLHRDGDGLVAAEVGLGGVEDLDLPAPLLGVPGVHAQQVAGEQRRLLAALAGLHLEDRVLVVGRVARHQQAAAAAPRPRAGAPSSVSTSSANVGSSAASSRAASMSSPRSSHSFLAVRTRLSCGVPLVEPLGQPGVGVRLGRAELLLELGVLRRAMLSTASNTAPPLRRTGQLSEIASADPRPRGHGSALRGSYLSASAFVGVRLLGGAFLA